MRTLQQKEEELKEFMVNYLGVWPIKATELITTHSSLVHQQLQKGASEDVIADMVLEKERMDENVDKLQFEDYFNPNHTLDVRRLITELAAKIVSENEQESVSSNFVSENDMLTEKELLGDESVELTNGFTVETGRESLGEKEMLDTSPGFVKRSGKFVFDTSNLEEAEDTEVYEDDEEDDEDIHDKEYDGEINNEVDEDDEYDEEDDEEDEIDDEDEDDDYDDDEEYDEEEWEEEEPE